MKDSLSKVMDWYETASEIQVLARKQLKETEKMSSNSNFAYLSSEEIFGKMKDVKAELDDLAVLSLVSVFESIVLDYISQAVKYSNTENQSFFELNFRKHIEKQAERWRFVEILDLFKGTIDSQIIGNVKKAYKYRNWVAHGKKTTKPESLDPSTTFNVLSDFLTRMPAIEDAVMISKI